MSNINDLCAKCHRGRWRHTNPRLPGCHAFVEPAPQPAPRGVWTAADIARGKALADGYKDVLPDAELASDEAKVREIVSEDDVLFKIAKEWTSGDYGRMVSAVREAYAAGKADVIDAIERRSKHELRYGDIDLGVELQRAADIARRGSEGK